MTSVTLIVTCLALCANTVEATPTPVPAPTPSPTPSPTTTSTSTTPGTTTIALHLLPEERKTVDQTISTANLNSYSDSTNYIAALKAHLATATNTSVNGINVTIQSIKIGVAGTLSAAVSATHLQTGLATQASTGITGTVPTGNVELLSAGGRRLEDSQDSDFYATERQLQAASTSVNADILVPSSANTDIVAQAKGIHGAVSNDAQLAATVGTAAGVSGLTANTNVKVKVAIQAVLANNGTLNAAAINSAVASAMGANVTGTVTDATTTAPPSNSGAEYSGRIQLVLVACVFLGLTRRFNA